MEAIDVYWDLYQGMPATARDFFQVILEETGHDYEPYATEWLRSETCSQFPEGTVIPSAARLQKLRDRDWRKVFPRKAPASRPGLLPMF
jgi:hypothetical protein